MPRAKTTATGTGKRRTKQKGGDTLGQYQVNVDKKDPLVVVQYVTKIFNLAKELDVLYKNVYVNIDNEYPIFFEALKRIGATADAAYHRYAQNASVNEAILDLLLEKQDVTQNVTTGKLIFNAWTPVSPESVGLQNKSSVLDDFCELMVLYHLNLLTYANGKWDIVQTDDAPAAVHDGWAIKTLCWTEAVRTIFDAKSDISSFLQDSDIQQIIAERSAQLREFASLDPIEQKKDRVSVIAILKGLDGFSLQNTANIVEIVKASDSLSPLARSASGNVTGQINAFDPDYSLDDYDGGGKRSGAQRKKQKVLVLGRVRNVHKDGRKKLVKYKNQLITLKEARSIEAKLRKSKK